MDNKASEKPTSHTKPTTSHKPTVKATTETVQHHESKTNTTGDSTSPKSPSKANTTIRKASKSPVRSSDKSPSRSPTKPQSKSPTRSPVRSPVRSPARSPVRSPPRSPPKPTNTKPIPTHTPSLIQTKTLSEITQILTCEINNDFIPISYFVIDEKKRTQELLRNRDSTYINLADEASLKPEKIRMAIISALRFDKHVVFDLMDNENLIEPLKKCCAEIEPNLFEDLFNGQIKNEDKFKKLIKDTDGDLYKPHFFVKENMKHFKVILLLNKLTENDVLIKLTSAYRVVN